MFGTKKSKMNECEAGSIVKSKVEVVVKADDFEGIKGVTIREYITSDKHVGFTKNGVRIPIREWGAFVQLVNKIKV